MTDKIRIGINGFSLIGRTVLRTAMTREDVEIVAINDLLPTDHLAYLLKYDSVHGGLRGSVLAADNARDINGAIVRAFSVQARCVA